MSIAYIYDKVWTKELNLFDCFGFGSFFWTGFGVDTLCDVFSVIFGVAWRFSDSSMTNLGKDLGSSKWIVNEISLEINLPRTQVYYLQFRIDAINNFFLNKAPFPP